MILASRSEVELVLAVTADIDLYICKSVLEEARPG